MQQTLSSIYRTWLDKNSPPFGLPMSEILESYNLKTQKIIGNHDELQIAITDMFDKLSEIEIPKNYLARPGNRGGDVTLSSHQLKNPMAKGTKRVGLVSHTPILTYEILSVDSSQAMDLASHMKVNTYFCGGILIINLLAANNKPDLKQSVDSGWKVLKSPLVQLTADSLELFEAWKASPENIKQLEAGVEKKVSSLLERGKQSTLKALNTNSKPIPSAAYGNSVGKGFRFNKLATAGRIAGLLGIAFGALQVHQGINNEDETEILAGAFSTTGATLALVHGLMIEGIITVGASLITPIGWLALGFVVLGVATSFLVDSDLETWVKFSFWGDSEEYWGRTRRTLENRLEECKKWQYKPSKDKTIEEYFKKEIGEFYDYTWGILIENPQKNDARVSLRSPLFEDEKSLEKLSITWEFDDGSVQYSGNMMMSQSYLKDLGSAKVEKEWIKKGQVDLIFNKEIMPDKEFKEIGMQSITSMRNPAKAKLTVSYPRFYSKQPFTANISFYSSSNI